MKTKREILRWEIFGREEKYVEGTTQRIVHVEGKRERIYREIHGSGKQLFEENHSPEKKHDKNMNRGEQQLKGNGRKKYQYQQNIVANYFTQQMQNLQMERTL